MNNKSKYLVEHESEITSSGLKGGAHSNKRKVRSCFTNNDLKLINRGSDCFVNSVIQLLRNTDYYAFIQGHLQVLLANSTPDSYRLSRLLYNIYNEESVKSVAAIRKYVALMSDKNYLDNGSQQDAEEFLRALDGVIFEELVESDEFKAVRELHWGREKISRKFIDNTMYGVCPTCGESPLTLEQPFLFLQLKNLPRATSVSSSITFI